MLQVPPVTEDARATPVSMHVRLHAVQRVIVRARLRPDEALLVVAQDGQIGLLGTGDEVERDLFAGVYPMAVATAGVSRALVEAQLADQALIAITLGMAGFEPAFSCSQGRWITRPSHIPVDSGVAREGIEPSSPH